MLRSFVLGVILVLNIRLGLSQYKEEYVRRYADVAVSEMDRTGIPASIKLSQAIVESNYGRSELAREAYNHFGIKCGREWGGKGYHLKDDDHDERGELVHSCFRVFTSAEESYIAHSDFLTDPGKAHRYGALFRLAPDDYKGWAEGLKRGGYATNPDYARLLIRIIEEQELYRYDVSGSDDVIASRHRKDQNANQKPDVLTGGNTYSIQFQNDVPYITALDGDLVRNVAKQTDVPVRRIMRFNEFVDNRRTLLEEGDRIYLQPLKRMYRGNQSWHIVEADETIATIAHDYGVKSDVLRKRNNIPAGCEPASGTRLVLRGKQRTPVRCASEQTIIASVPSRTSIPQEKATIQGVSSPVSNTPEPKKEPEKKTEPAVIQATVPGLSDVFVKQILSYTVQPKDTLYQIATKYGISIAELKQLNNLTSDTIHPGQSLKVQK